jgi:hypothetical protein
VDGQGAAGKADHHVVVGLATQSHLEVSGSPASGRQPILQGFGKNGHIGQDLERDVVAEGLEDAGMIEAAALLGCRFGQGFSIARPMPASALTDWLRMQPFHGVDSAHVASWVGALAYQWMSMHDTRQQGHPGDWASCPITGFLAAQDIADPELQATHRQIHDHPLRPVRLHAMRRMTHWMIGKTHALYAARCEQALVN